MMRKLTLILLLLYTGLLNAAEVTAKLSQDTVAAGRGAMLTINVTDGKPRGGIQMPEVEGLIIRSRGTSYSNRYANGNVTSSVSYSYLVGSNTVGVYQIPAIRVVIDGKEYLTDPLELNVKASVDTKPQGMGGEEPEEETTPMAQGRLTMQMVASDRDYVYAGEIAPVRIRAYFPANSRVSLNGAPRPEGSAFTLHHLSEEPEQKTEIIDGKRYLVVTWYGGLSATKAGTYPSSIHLEGTMLVREKAQRRRRPSAFDDPFFGDSMFDDFFAPMVEKDFELSTDTENSEVIVKELPLEGRPENFTGAIGKFKFESLKIPSTLQTGEPCRIQAVLEGEGNFSLLSAPQPTPTSEWKSYSGKDQFEGGDVASFGGRKAFSYSAVPLSPGEKEVSLSFSYFDPDAAKYVKVNSDPQKVTISGEVVTNSTLSDGPPAPSVTPDVPQLAPLATKLGGVKNYEPLLDRVWFVPAIASCGFLSLALLGFGWWQVKAADPDKLSQLELDRATAEAMSNAEQAVSAGDAGAFISAAREAMRLRIAEERGINPMAVTAADLGEVDDEVVVSIFNEADRMDYSGEKYAMGDLASWKVKLDEVIRNLSNKKKS